MSLDTVESKCGWWIRRKEDEGRARIKRGHVRHNILSTRLRGPGTLITVLSVHDCNRIISQVAEENVGPGVVRIVGETAPRTDNAPRWNRVVVQLPLVIREGRL